MSGFLRGGQCRRSIQAIPVGHAEAKDAHGRPVSGAKLFSWDPYSYVEFLGTTDGDGRTPPEARPFGMLIGLAKDGRVAVSADSTKGNALVFGPARSLWVRLVDDAGKPIKGKWVLLGLTSLTAPLRPYGQFRFLPGYPPEIAERLEKKTDDGGNAAFPNVCTNCHFCLFVDVQQPMLTRARFYEPMCYFGTVTPGESNKVWLSANCVIHGQVYGPRGRPVKGQEVWLRDTGYFHASGYPGTTLEKVWTDARGSYRFSALPNCSFNVTLEDPVQARAGHQIIWSRVDGGKLDTNGQATRVVLRQHLTRCDFKIVSP